MLAVVAKVYSAHIRERNQLVLILNIFLAAEK